jgi:16S rRNA (cytidine1402-2'-O)-methyltransferase
VVATPIGNLEDITHRAVRVLGEVEVIAAEDTRSARVLLGHYEIRTPVVSCFAGNEARRAEELVTRLRAGAAVALISEAGMPGISDPGARLVARCLAETIAIDVVPGPSAAVTALVLSGLPTERFTFVGFLPRAGRERRRALAELADSTATLVIYEAPPRVGTTLADLQRSLGDRPAALVREMTKLHQEAVRGSLAALAARYAGEPPRGEVTLVVGGAPPAAMDEGELRGEVQARLAAGERPREIAAALAEHGKRAVYQLALELSRPPAHP